MIDLFHVVDKSPVGLYICDRDGRVNYCNAAAADLLGAEADGSLLGLWKIYYPDGLQMPVSRSPMALALKEGLPYDSQQLTIQRRDGTFKNLIVYARPLFDENNVLTGLHNTLIDVTTDQHQGNRNAILSAIVESSDDAIISKDLDGTIKSWNAGAQRIFGYTEEEAIGKSILMLIPASRHQEEELILNNIKHGRRVEHFETIRVDRNGREVPISLTVSPIKDAGGLVVGASKVARDISERHDALNKQAMLAAIVESSDDAIVSKKLDGTITSWNQGAARIFGYTESEIVGKNISILIPASRLDEEERIISNISKGNKFDHFQTIRLHKDGHEIHISLTVSPIKDCRGVVVGASKVARDITPHVHAQQLIKQYTNNLETLNEMWQGITGKMDEELILQRVIDATTKITGAAYGAFFDDAANETGKVAALNRQGIVRVDDLSKDPTFGEAIYNFIPEKYLPLVSFLSVPVKAHSGETMGVLFFSHPEPVAFTAEQGDIVATIAAQAALAIDNSRLFEQVKSLSARKDEFIALASHELKTPLTSVKGYLQILAKGERNPLQQRFFTKSINQVDKLNVLVEDMLNMSKIEAGKLVFNFEIFDLKDLLLETIDTFAHTNTTHQIIQEIEAGEIFVQADRQRIEQALINLIGNAIKYSPKADRIRVSLKEEKDIVRFSVQDYGIGLTEEQRQKMFSRFYRAEGTEGISGLGLGLYLTKQIIDLHQGQMQVSSEFGKGSVFWFSLPSIDTVL